MMNNITTMETPKGTIWHVPLPGNSQYPYTLFHRRFASLSNYSVVLVIINKLIEYNARDSVAPARPFHEWDPEKSAGMMDFMRPSEFSRNSVTTSEELGSVEMPIASIRIRKHCESPGLLGFLRGQKNKIIEQPVVAFTNGRHRIRFSEAMGAKIIPIEVENRHIDLMNRYCGSESG